MTEDQDCAAAAATPSLLLWSRVIQGAAAVVIALSSTLLLSPRLREAIFNLVYFYQLSMPVEVPSLAHGYVRFANGIVGAVMAIAAFFSFVLLGIHAPGGHGVPYTHKIPDRLGASVSTPAKAHRPLLSWHTLVQTILALATQGPTLALRRCRSSPSSFLQC